MKTPTWLLSKLPAVSAAGPTRADLSDPDPRAALGSRTRQKHACCKTWEQLKRLSFRSWRSKVTPQSNSDSSASSSVSCSLMERLNGQTEENCKLGYTAAEMTHTRCRCWTGGTGTHQNQRVTWSAANRQIIITSFMPRKLNRLPCEETARRKLSPTCFCLY